MSSSMKHLITGWQKDGALAFEDAPGTWLKSKDDGECLDDGGS